MTVAVVGHVEWVDFLVLPRLPRPGEIVHATGAHEGPGGGGAMAARALAALTGVATFLCAVGDDARGERTAEGLRAAGIDVRAAVRAGVAQRRAVAWLTGDGDRSITVVGEDVVPRGDDPLDWPALAGCDGVLLMAGDAGAVRAARAVPLLVASPRARGPVVAAGVAVDVLVGSAVDPLEAIDDELLAAARPRHVVRTEGAAGGSWRAADGTTGRWVATPPPGARVDDYGCGDAFAAALTAALAAGRPIADACALAARVGAALLCQRAPAVGGLGALWVAHCGG
ncbi:PfkB family carbohydrate kinase [Baekduia soli]|uniref:PfkB family carbohydrate kinase n=1 Tax=Baekduia soli TaxID=496014 RepID=UPI0016520FC9|nr:PfkB family carbohydrate kinase [Baekduia soli]